MTKMSTYAAADISLTPAERRRAGIETAEPLWFDAVLRPHRSLTRDGFLALVVVAGGVSLLAALRFWSLGAWPVATIFLLDAVLLYVMIRLSYTAARGFETLQLRASALILTRVSWRGRVESRVFHPNQVRVSLVGTTPAMADLVLEEGGRSERVGRDIPPAERVELAEALGRALDGKRAGGSPMPDQSLNRSSSE